MNKYIYIYIIYYELSERASCVRETDITRIMNRGLTCGRNYWTNLHHARTIEQQQPLKFNFNIWCLTATTHKTILRSVKNATSTPTGESNLGSTVYRAAALTTELSGLLARKLFIHTLSRDLHDPRPGFEPGTSANRADALPLSHREHWSENVLTHL